MTTILVRAIVVDTTQLTAYLENGDVLNVPQGDPRLAEIVKQVYAQKTQPIKTVVLEEMNPYKDVEEKSGGLIKFFRVAKSKLSTWFSKADAVPPVVIGSADVIAADPTKQETAGVQPATMNNGIPASVQEIIDHAVPASSLEFTSPTVAKTESIATGSNRESAAEQAATDTIVAVVDGQVVHGVEKLSNQITRAAAKGQSVTGMQNLLTRMAAIAGKRRHSNEDLLKFMERGDLPVADDGSILIYKVLRTDSNSQNRFVDCHTRKVSQKVGSYVYMDEKLVDMDRNNECSNGLHVARRAYVGNFDGDVCVLAKVNPEDVITVPSYDANKMRVCGYHIIALLTPAQYSRLKRNQNITDTAEGQQLLADAIAGRHIGITELVKITGQRGGGVQTSLPDTVQTEQESTGDVESSVPIAATTKAVEPVVAAVEALDDAEATNAPAVEPAKLNENTTVATLSVQAQGKKLHDEFSNEQDVNAKKQIAKALLLFKKSKKKGWEALGVTTAQGAEVVKAAE